MVEPKSDDEIVKAPAWLSQKNVMKLLISEMKKAL
jgi:hypothetical protein